MIKIGIQGGVGSTNEQAAQKFLEQQGWREYKIEYLFTSKNVLRDLAEGRVDYGVFAWGAPSGLVEETQIAVQEYPNFKKVDEVSIHLDHALLQRSEIDESQEVNIYSHPQALREHYPFLDQLFPNKNLHAEKDTALAAEMLKIGEYPHNSLVIAPLRCAEIYGLDIYKKDLPSNKDYVTKFYLVKK